MTDLTATIRPPSLPAAPARLRFDAMTFAGLQGLGAVGLWLAILAREWPRLTALGQICGEADSLFGHCALCAPALGLTVGALLSLAAAARR